MTKLLRFAGVALLALTIGVFGCGDDETPLAPTVTVTVPTPPTPPTPPPPPVVVTMSPASQTIGVGGTVVFAVSVSGGVAGEAATWTCASSDLSKATVEDTPAGCQATAVAAGGVTITAAVTKGGATVNTGAGLTITEDMAERAFLVLASITDSDDDDEVLSGRVSVELSVERGDQMLEQLSVLVDGVVAVLLPFGGASAVAASQDEPAQQAVHAFVLSFNSAEYDAVTGVPTYMNGEHTISAELMVASSDEPLGSGLHAREFGNDDGYIVTADLGDNSAIGDDGRQWYGGPGNGTIDITALPVSYGGGSVTTVSANFCGEDATDSDGSDGYTFEFECEDRESNTDADEGVVGDMLALSSVGESGMILNDDHPFPAFVDFMGPSESPIIVANRNGRENGWLNAAVALTGEVDDDDDDNWLVEGADETGGIGGYNMMLLMGEDLEKALEASPSSTLPAESAAKDSYCAIASATDDLGNMSELPDPDDDATCRTAPEGADALDMTTERWGQIDDQMMLTDDVSGQTLKFGVDTTDPTIEFADDYDDDNRHNEIDGNGLAFAFEPEDDESNVGNSGLVQDGGLGSLLVGIQRRTASETECPVIGEDGEVSDTDVDDDCESVAITSEDVTLQSGAGVGYYTLSGMAQDAAGNSSDAISHTFVYDNEVATATAPSVPGVIEAGKPFDGASFLNDDLSIRDYYGAANFTGVLSLGIGKPIAVDEFNASSLTNRNHTVNATVDTYAGLQESEGGNIQAVSGATVAVRDQTQAIYTSMPATFTVDDAPNLEDGFPATNADDGFTLEFQGRNDGGVYAFCGIEECADDDAETSVKIEVRARAQASGTFGDPFERVDFWVTDINGVSWMVGSDASGTSSRVGGDLENARNRTWTYSVTLPGTMLNMATRPGIGGTETPMIRAVAVNDNNVGLVESTGVAIDTTAP